nr:E3 ubiquitin-protein ligase XBAT32 [Tanacetum cinerariifolium]
MPHAVEGVQVFTISGAKFLKQNRGTWHAGPLFKPSTAMDFYNTNVSINSQDWGFYLIVIHVFCFITPTDGGVTTFHMAVLNGHVDSLQLLSDLRAFVNEVTMEDGTTIDWIGAGRTPLYMLHAVELHNVVIYQNYGTQSNTYRKDLRISPVNACITKGIDLFTKSLDVSQQLNWKLK